MKNTMKLTMALVACTAGMNAMADGSPWDEAGGMVDVEVFHLSTAKNLVFAPGLNSSDAAMRQAADHLCRGTGRGVVADYTLRELDTFPGQKVQLHAFTPNVDGLSLMEQTVTAGDSLQVLDRVYCIDDDRAVRARPEPLRNRGTVALQYFEKLKADGIQTRHLTDEYNIKPGTPDPSLITERLRERAAEHRDVVGQLDIALIDLSNVAKKFAAAEKGGLAPLADDVCRGLGLGVLGEHASTEWDTFPGGMIDVHAFARVTERERDLLRTQIPSEDSIRILKKIACLESQRDQNPGVLASAYQVALSDQGMTVTWMRLDDPRENDRPAGEKVGTLESAIDTTSSAGTSRTTGAE